MEWGGMQHRSIPVGSIPTAPSPAAPSLLFPNELVPACSSAQLCSLEGSGYS